jgi:hypothetical protein
LTACGTRVDSNHAEKKEKCFFHHSVSFLYLKKR